MTSWQLLILVLFILTTYVLLIAYLVNSFAGANGKLVTAIDEVRCDIEAIKNQQASGVLILELAHSLNDEIAEFRSPLSKLDILRFVKSACRQMARSFTDSLGVDCRVCVKQVLDTQTDRPRVRAVERSDRRVGSPESELHYIDENTDFNELYRNGKKYWFSNNVEGEAGYINSSPNRKYHSTIVWPVITRVSDKPVPDDDRFAPVAAFLCIDSDPPDVFARDIHVPLGWAIADALARAFESAEGTPMLTR
jgi:hypothetical protein